MSTSQAYWQVNSSLGSTNWWLYVVVHVDNDAAAFTALTAEDFQVETGSAPLAEGVRGPAIGAS